MIKYIEDYKSIKGSEQYKKINEEVIEASNEYFKGDREKEIQELCDIIQACYTRFNQMGLVKEDIQREFNKHYEKETLRGRKVVEIKGTSYQDGIRSQLLNAIRFLENEMIIKDNKIASLRRTTELKDEKIAILKRRIELKETIIEVNEEVYNGIKKLNR